MFPLSFSAIAPFLTDIGSGRGKGSVFYRAEESLDVLIRASIMVQQGFYGSAFKSSPHGTMLPVKRKGSNSHLHIVYKKCIPSSCILSTV